MQFWVNSLFILELLSKENSFAYNLLDVSIQSVYLEIVTDDGRRCILIPILTSIYNLFASFATNAFTKIGLMIESLFYQLPN